MANEMSNADPVFSFCVKCIRPEVTEEIICNVLKNIGTINHIDFIEKTTTLPDNPLKHYRIAFIHLKNWSRYFENIAVRGAFIDKLLSGINYVYDNEGHYFTLHENYNPKYKTKSYITYLEKELEQAKKTADNYYEHLQNEHNKNARNYQINRELGEINQQLIADNRALQQQVQWLTSQYVPNTFPQVNNLNPSAPPYYQETHTQVSDTCNTERH